MSHRFTHDRAIQEHCHAKHPGVTPAEAYRAKQREDKTVRARMSVRGHKVGALKREAAQAKLESIPFWIIMSFGFVLPNTSVGSLWSLSLFVGFAGARAGPTGLLNLLRVVVVLRIVRLGGGSFVN